MDEQEGLSRELDSLGRALVMQAIAWKRRRWHHGRRRRREQLLFCSKGESDGRRPPRPALLALSSVASQRNDSRQRRKRAARVRKSSREIFVANARFVFTNPASAVEYRGRRGAFPAVSFRYGEFE